MEVDDVSDAEAAALPEGAVASSGTGGADPGRGQRRPGEGAAASSSAAGSAVGRRRGGRAGRGAAELRPAERTSGGDAGGGH